MTTDHQHPQTCTHDGCRDLNLGGPEAMAILRTIWLSGYASGVASAFMTATSPMPGLPHEFKKHAAQSLAGRLRTALEADRCGIEMVDQAIERLLTGRPAEGAEYVINHAPRDVVTDTQDGGQ